MQAMASSYVLSAFSGFAATYQADVVTAAADGVASIAQVIKAVVVEVSAWKRGSPNRRDSASEVVALEKDASFKRIFESMQKQQRVFTISSEAKGQGNPTQGPRI